MEYTSAVEKVEYFPYSIREVKSLQLVNDDTAEYSFKYADRSVLDRNFALRGNADDVVIVRSGMLTDTSIANIALYKEGKEESAIVKFGQMEDVLEECYNFNNSFSNVQEIEKIKKKALIDNIWNKY